MDQLLKRIHERRSELAEAEARLEQLEESMRVAAERFTVAMQQTEALKIELRALEEANKLRPSPDSLSNGQASIFEIPSQPDRARRGGRQPGAITIKWRRALADLIAAGNEPVDIDTFYLLTRGRLGLAEASVRERVRNYVSSGILEEVAGKVKVSPHAIVSMNLRSFIAENNSASPLKGEAVISSDAQTSENGG